MARDRNKPTQSWMERAKIEIEYEEELTIERAYELGKIRGVKETIDKACECFELAEDWQAWANYDFEYAKSYFRKVMEEE